MSPPGPVGHAVPSAPGHSLGRLWGHGETGGSLAMGMGMLAEGRAWLHVAFWHCHVPPRGDRGWVPHPCHTACIPSPGAVPSQGAPSRTRRAQPWVTWPGSTWRCHPQPLCSWDHPSGAGNGAGRSPEGRAQVGQVCLPLGRCTSFLRCPQELAASCRSPATLPVCRGPGCAHRRRSARFLPLLPPPRCSGPAAPHRQRRAQWPKCLRCLPALWALLRCWEPPRAQLTAVTRVCGAGEVPLCVPVCSEEHKGV